MTVKPMGIKDRLFWKASADRVPLHGAFELSPICNLSCRMCYARRTEAEVAASGGLLTAEQWLSIAREAVEQGMLFLLLTGGEPFLYPGFRELYENLQKMGLMISINSNGTLLDRPTVTWLSKNSPLRVNVTIYGASRESYASLCGSADAFDRVKEGISLLREAHIPVRLNVSLTPQNGHEFEAIYLLSKEWGVPLVAATYMFPPARRPSFRAGIANRLTPQEAARMRVEYEYLTMDRASFLRQAERAQKLSSAKTGRDPVLCDEGGCKMQCRAGRASFWAAWDGRMNMCGMIDSPSADLLKDGFEKSWQQITRATNAVRFSAPCADCEKRELCHPCAAMSWCETGAFAGRPQYLCELADSLVQQYADKLKLLKAGDNTIENQ